MACIKKGALQAFVDGELPEKEKQVIALHLQACEKCRGVLAEIQADRDFLRDKMESLGPAAIPRLVFSTDQIRRRQEPRAFFVLPLLRKSVHVPAAAVILTALAFAGLLLGLFAQNQRLAKLEASLSKKESQTILYISSGETVQAYALDLTLDNYKPIQNPDVILLRGN